MVEPLKHHFPWSSIITAQSQSCSGSSLTDESVVEQYLCQSSLARIDSRPPCAAACCDEQTQTDAPPLTPAALRPVIREAVHLLLAEYQFYYQCSKCRRAFFDSLLRTCVVCRFYLCAACEETHTMAHPIAYVRRKGQLKKD